MKAISTFYRGHLFRSRLEARWAAFFQAIGWTWEYEPVDFNGWIPDFGIYGSQVTYVEIKPVVTFPKDVAEKIDRSGCLNEVLILGETVPIPLHRYSGVEYFGWLRKNTGDEENPFWWQGAELGRWKQRKGQIGFCGCGGSFQDRIFGGHDGGCWGALELDIEEVKRIWASAGNETRWSKKDRLNGDNIERR